MEDFSLYILDITTNSVRAGATEIEISLVENDNFLTFSVKDNGCGMTKQQVENLTNPFFTTRKTRKVGFGVPFLNMLSEMTGGSLKITSIPQSEGENHGTTLVATFGKNHIDFVPMGDVVQTLTTLIHGSPEIDFVFSHKLCDGKEVYFSCAEIRQILGDISLASPEILQWITQNLNAQYEDIQCD